MDYFGLIFYQLLIFFVSYCSGHWDDEQFGYQFRLDWARVENRQEKWKSVLLSKYLNSDSFTFNVDRLKELCGDAFSTSDVEIVEVFNRAMRLSLIRETDDELHEQVFLNLLFSDRTSIDLFFGDIRWPKRQECGTKMEVFKMFQYRILELKNVEITEPPLQLLGDRIIFYPKDLDPVWFANPKCFNFVDFDYDESRTQGVNLVLLSKTFNISRIIDTNKYVLCSSNVPTHQFILQFRNGDLADKFYSAVKNDLNGLIRCSGGWVTDDILRKLKYCT